MRTIFLLITLTLQQLSFSEDSSSNAKNTFSDPKDGIFSLSLKTGSRENNRYGVRLIAVGGNFATIVSTSDNKFDKALVGKYFDGGSFGRIGLRLIRTDPATKTAFFKRNLH